MDFLADQTPNAVMLLILYQIVIGVVIPQVQKRNGNAKPKSSVQMEREIHELHVMHDEKDGDGRYRWWMPAGFDATLKDNTKSNRELTIAVRSLEQEIRKNGK